MADFLPTLPNAGALAFGAVIGWLVYYINRYRKADVQFSDVTTIIGIVGGAGVTSLFGSDVASQKQAMFGAYGIGLFLGFFAYFIALVIMVRGSGGEFSITWFLDGRRKDPTTGIGYPAEPPAPGNRPFIELAEQVEQIRMRQNNLIDAQPASIKSKIV
ncbi:hypothetical protein [Mesorhizobium amorphae]|uniref:hypothetical protein n=1 Tax=Mesorhizobium amorphae TaxID=71433 RepID=UPI001783A0AA|nr:hypothetical protein [Mesorhizobium amorphae]